MKLFATAFLGLLAVSALNAAIVIDSNVSPLIMDSAIEALATSAVETLNTERAECLRDGVRGVVDDNQEIVQWYNDVRDVFENARLEAEDCEGRRDCLDEVRTAARFHLVRLLNVAREYNYGRQALAELREVILFCLRRPDFNSMIDAGFAAPALNDKVPSFEELPFAPVEDIEFGIVNEELTPVENNGEAFEFPPFPTLG